MSHEYRQSLSSWHIFRVGEGGKIDLGGFRKRTDAESRMNILKQRNANVCYVVSYVAPSSSTVTAG